MIIRRSISTQILRATMPPIAMSTVFTLEPRVAVLRFVEKRFQAEEFKTPSLVRMDAPNAPQLILLPTPSRISHVRCHTPVWPRYRRLMPLFDADTKIQVLPLLAASRSSLHIRTNWFLSFQRRKLQSFRISFQSLLWRSIRDSLAATGQFRGMTARLTLVVWPKEVSCTDLPLEAICSSQSSSASSSSRSWVLVYGTRHGALESAWSWV